MLKHTRAAIIITLTAAGLLGGCSDAPVERSPAIPPVRIMELTPPAETAFRNFPGEASAFRNASLSFDVPGRLVDFPVYDGMIVDAGDMIGRLDPTDFQARFDTARSRFITARDELQRQQTLLDRKVIARSEFDRQREAFDVAEANLRTAQKALEDTLLSAPFKGRVAHRFVRNFQTVQPGELIVLLQDISSLKIDIQLPESAIPASAAQSSAANLNPMIEARAEFASLPGRVFELTLDSFATRANPASRTFPVSFLLEPPEDGSILPGMTCNVFVRFVGQQASPASPGFLLPATALSTNGGESAVWKWDPQSGTVSRVVVELIGPSGEGFLVSAESLSPGNRIVTSGVRFLSEGMKVRELDVIGR